MLSKLSDLLTELTVSGTDSKVFAKAVAGNKFKKASKITIKSSTLLPPKIWNKLETWFNKQAKMDLAVIAPDSKESNRWGKEYNAKVKTSKVFLMTNKKLRMNGY